MNRLSPARILKLFSLVDLCSFVRACVLTLIGGYASEELAAARHEICSDCKYVDVEDTSCSLCGCGVMDRIEGRSRVLEKTYHKSAHCPIRKW